MFISEFKAQMPGGGARPNHFRIELDSPIGNLSGPNVELLCKASTLPSTNINDIPVMYRGRAVHFAGEQSFQPWTVSIINEDSFYARDVLEQWSNLMQNYNATMGEKHPQGYVKTLYVNQLDRNDNIIYGYKFYQAYPINIGEIQISYDMPNAIEEFQVTFVYDYFEPNPSGGTTGGGS